jgi:hypothetical protein
MIALLALGSAALAAALEGGAQMAADISVNVAVISGVAAGSRVEDSKRTGPGTTGRPGVDDGQRHRGGKSRARQPTATRAASGASRSHPTGRVEHLR